MGQGPSTPETTKSHSSITQISKIFKSLTFSSNIKKHDLTYTNINNSKILQFIQCNYYTPKQFSDIDNNLLPKFCSDFSSIRLKTLIAATRDC